MAAAYKPKERNLSGTLILNFRTVRNFCCLSYLLLLLSRFSRVWLCATPQTAAPQAPPSLGFFRQEHWSGLPSPFPAFRAFFISIMGFPGGSDSKEYACNAGDLGSIPGSGRYPGRGHGNPLQYSCLESSMDRGNWQATGHGVVKSWTQLSD